MMSEKGYDNIVISDVCKELGISIGCFYMCGIPTLPKPAPNWKKILLPYA